MKKITEGREVVPSYHKQKEMEKGGWGGGQDKERWWRKRSALQNVERVEK